MLALMFAVWRNFETEIAVLLLVLCNRRIIEYCVCTLTSHQLITVSDTTGNIDIQKEKKTEHIDRQRYKREKKERNPEQAKNRNRKKTEHIDIQRDQKEQKEQN
jgi:hypothetical protein